MPLLPRPTHADPELWRAVHTPPATLPMLASASASADADADIIDEPATLHGMPADRLAMAASRLPERWARAAHLS